MTFHDVSRLYRHWNKHPPLRTLVAAVAGALGVNVTPSTEKPQHMTAEEAMRLMQITGGKIDGIAKVGGG